MEIRFRFMQFRKIAAIISAILFLASILSLGLKGLNLALVTLALVFVGSHIFSNMVFITGGSGVGRRSAKLVLFGNDLSSGMNIGNYFLEEIQIFYLFF